ncbi:MAG: Xaa-Pro dipeptidase [Pseudomonadota bacterium]
MIFQNYASHVRAQRSLYNRVLEQSHLDAAVIYAGRPALQFLDDNAYPFKVNPLFKAWLPVLDAPDSFVIHRPGHKPMLVYCQPIDFWHATPDEPDPAWADQFDVQIVRHADDARAVMPEGRSVLFGDAPDAVRNWGFEQVNPAELLNTLHFARAWKTDYEIDCLTEATALGVAGHTAARNSFERGESEFDIHLAFLQATGLSDADLPYTDIVALNEHAAILHYTLRDHRAPSERRSFLIDAGAHAHGYASDITRTYSADKGLFADLIKAVDAVQQSLCNALRPNVDYVALHEDALVRLSGILADASVIKCSAEDAFANGIATAFFPHGLGHFIGLQVHDVGGFMANEGGTHVAPPEHSPSLRLTRTLEASHVVTIEPGLYFIPQLLDPVRESRHRDLIDWQAVDHLLPYGGIRIEDNVVVTAGAPRNLTREAFTTA